MRLAIRTLPKPSVFRPDLEGACFDDFENSPLVVQFRKDDVDVYRVWDWEKDIFADEVLSRRDAGRFDFLADAEILVVKRAIEALAKSSDSD